MNISHRLRYVYFVIPKCASKTVRHSLAPLTDVGYPVDDFPQHMKIAEFEQTELFDQTASYFKFTFVRNPYDRLYSGYLQDRLAAGKYYPWTLVKPPIFSLIGDDFNRYMKDFVAQSDIKRDWDWICFCPMTEFAYREGKLYLDFVGRSECLAQGLRELSDKLDHPIEQAPNMNVQTEPCAELKYMDKYDRDTVAMVNELYREDFEAFDYPRLDPMRFPRAAA